MPRMNSNVNNQPQDQKEDIQRFSLGSSTKMILIIALFFIILCVVSSSWAKTWETVRQRADVAKDCMMKYSSSSCHPSNWEENNSCKEALICWDENSTSLIEFEEWVPLVLGKVAEIQPFVGTMFAIFSVIAILFEAKRRVL